MGKGLNEPVSMTRMPRPVKETAMTINKTKENKSAHTNPLPAEKFSFMTVERITEPFEETAVM